MNQLKSVRRKCYEILCKIRGGGGVIVYISIFKVWCDYRVLI